MPTINGPGAYNRSPLSDPSPSPVSASGLVAPRIPNFPDVNRSDIASEIGGSALRASQEATNIAETLQKQDALNFKMELELSSSDKYTQIEKEWRDSVSTTNASQSVPRLTGMLEKANEGLLANAPNRLAREQGAQALTIMRARFQEQAAEYANNVLVKGTLRNVQNKLNLSAAQAGETPALDLAGVEGILSDSGKMLDDLAVSSTVISPADVEGLKHEFTKDFWPQVIKARFASHPNEMYKIWTDEKKRKAWLSKVDAAKQGDVSFFADNQVEQIKREREVAYRKAQFTDFMAQHAGSEFDTAWDASKTIKDPEVRQQVQSVLWVDNVRENKLQEQKKAEEIEKQKSAVLLYVQEGKDLAEIMPFLPVEVVDYAISLKGKQNQFLTREEKDQTFTDTLARVGSSRDYTVSELEKDIAGLDPKVQTHLREVYKMRESGVLTSQHEIAMNRGIASVMGNYDFSGNSAAQTAFKADLQSQVTNWILRQDTVPTPQQVEEYVRAMQTDYIESDEGRVIFGERKITAPGGDPWFGSDFSDVAPADVFDPASSIGRKKTDPYYGIPDDDEIVEGIKDSIMFMAPGIARADITPGMVMEWWYRRPLDWGEDDASQQAMRLQKELHRMYGL